MLIRTGQLLSARALVKTREPLSIGRYINPGNASAALPQPSRTCRSAWMTAQEWRCSTLPLAPSTEMLLCIRPCQAS
jgi:hypothetical protein